MPAQMRAPITSFSASDRLFQLRGQCLCWLRHDRKHLDGRRILSNAAGFPFGRNSTPIFTAYKKADGTWGGSSSSEPHDAIVRTKSVYGNARQRYGVNRPRRTRRTSSKNQIISMY